MKASRYFTLLTLFAPLGILPLSAQAMPMHMAMGSKPAQSPSMANAQIHRGTGTINRIDMNSGRVNITHGPIPSLGWSGMTMDFQTKNKEELQDLKPGQKVNFDLIKGADGQYLITRLAPAK